MANTKARCSFCHNYFPQPTFFYSNNMVRLCTETCFNEWRNKKTPTTSKSKPKPKRSAPPKVPVELRLEIHARDHDACRWCMHRGSEVHHVAYRSEGGPNEPSNLILLCGACHARAHSSKEAFKPLLLATIWMLYVERMDLTVPRVAEVLRRRGLLSELQQERLAG